MSKELAKGLFITTKFPKINICFYCKKKFLCKYSIQEQRCIYKSCESRYCCSTKCLKLVSLI